MYRKTSFQFNCVKTVKGKKYYRFTVHATFTCNRILSSYSLVTIIPEIPPGLMCESILVYFKTFFSPVPSKVQDREDEENLLYDESRMTHYYVKNFRYVDSLLS